MAVQKKLRQDKRRGKSVKRTFHIFDSRLIIRKMKVSIVVVCLAVIFGSICCKTFVDRTNIDLIEGAADENHNTNYFNVPLTKALSRYKRDSTLFPPITDEIGHLIGIDSNGLIKTVLNFSHFITGLLTEQDDFCSKKPSTSGLEEDVTFPIQVIKSIICRIFSIVGKEKRHLMRAALAAFAHFMGFVVLPAVHKVLNLINDTGILPPTLKGFVVMFNITYMILKLMGMVK